MMKINDQTFMVTASGERLQVRLLQPEGLDPAAGPATLVFLHESLGCIAQWRDFPQTLVEATGLPALVYDRCGFGGSQPLEVQRGLNYQEREVECLHDLLHVCAVTRPLLVGHSDGATLSLLYAATFPEHPLAVISEAAHLFVEEETLAGIRAAVERWHSTDFRERLMRTQGEHTDRVFFAWTDTWLDPGFRSWSISERMRDVSCPVLAIQGEEDEYGTIKQIESIAAGVSGSCRTRLIPGCGHIPHREARDEVLAEMTSFIKALIRPPGPDVEEDKKYS